MTSRELDIHERDLCEYLAAVKAGSRLTHRDMQDCAERGLGLLAEVRRLREVLRVTTAVAERYLYHEELSHGHDFDAERMLESAREALGEEPK